MYIAAPDMTTIVNTTTMTDIAVLPHSTYLALSPGSYVPLGDKYMVTSHLDDDPVDILRYLNASKLFDTADLPNFSSAYANDVVIYKNGSGVDIPIVVLARNVYAGTIQVWSPNYQFTIPGSNYYVSGYVQNDQFILHYISSDADRAHTVAFYNAVRRH